MTHELVKFGLVANVSKMEGGQLLRLAFRLLSTIWVVRHFHPNLFKREDVPTIGGGRLLFVEN